MHLIVTRPKEDSEGLTEKLVARGHEVTSVPMISIEFLDGVCIPERTWQAILVTSANSIRALEALGADESLSQIPVLAVGPASSAAARSAGFVRVESAGGDLPALTALAAKTLEPASGPLFYPSGTRISGDLAGQLKAEGFECIRLPLYDAVAATGLPETLSNRLQDGSVDGVLLYSPRTAKTWASCIAAQDLSEEIVQTTHWCLSAAVGKALAEAWPGDPAPLTMIAPEPNGTSMIEAICAGP